MAGTTEGGKKAAQTLGKQHLATIGSKGGKKSPSTFLTVPGLAKRAGQLSGLTRRIKMHAKQIAALEAEQATLTDAQVLERTSIGEQIEAAKMAMADLSQKREAARNA